MSAVRRALPFAGVLLLMAAFTAAAFRLQRGGMIHSECGEQYFLWHFSGRPLAEVVFSTNNEAPYWMKFYRPRPLSNLLDHADYRFVLACIRRGRPHFISATYLLCFFIISCLLWSFCRRGLSLDPSSSAALLCLSLTSPFTLLHTQCFHTAKVLVALTACAFFYLSQDRGSGPSRPSWAMFLLYLSLGVLAGLSDEQGVGIIGVICVLAGIDYLATRELKGLSAFCAGVLSIEISLLFYSVLGPALWYQFSGEYPNLARSQAMFSNVLRSGVSAVLRDGVRFYVETFGFVCGDLPHFAAVAVLGGMALPLPGPGDPARTRRLGPLFTFLASHRFVFFSLGMILLCGMMVGGHPPLREEDVKRAYYGLPLAALLAFFLASGAAQAAKRWRLPAWATPVLLWLLVVRNLLAVPGHLAIMRRMDSRGYYTESPKLLEAFRDLRRKPPAGVEKHPMYRFLKTGENLFSTEPLAGK